MYKWTGNHTYWSLKNNWGTLSKTVFKICEGTWCSSFYVKEFDVIVHKIISLYNPIDFFAILYPKSLANLVVAVGTRHSHQILFPRAYLIIISMDKPSTVGGVWVVLYPEVDGLYDTGGDLWAKHIRTRAGVRGRCWNQKGLLQPWRLKSRTTRLFVQQLVLLTTKKTSTLRIATIGNPPVTGGFNSHKTNNTENFLSHDIIIMAWTGSPNIWGLRKQYMFCC